MPSNPCGLCSLYYTTDWYPSQAESTFNKYHLTCSFPCREDAIHNILLLVMGMLVINLCLMSNKWMSFYQHQSLMHFDYYVNVNLISTILTQILHFIVTCLVWSWDISLFVLALFLDVCGKHVLVFWQRNKMSFLSNKVE